MDPSKYISSFHFLYAFVFVAQKGFQSISNLYKLNSYKALFDRKRKKQRVGVGNFNNVCASA